MDVQDVIAGLSQVYGKYKESMGDKKMTVGELQELIKTASDVALDVFDVRDHVLIDLSDG
jgi:hypothetical protein